VKEAAAKAFWETTPVNVKSKITNLADHAAAA
jgi:hypothetical protein